MTQLLVSVRSADEAREALAGGADWIDVKEPAHGSLGAAAPTVWRQVAEVVGERARVSVACGELVDHVARHVAGTLRVPSASCEDSDGTRSVTTTCSSWPGISHAKLGLSSCGPAWQADWLSWREQLPAAVQPVLVAYADWEQAQSPPPEEVFAFAADRHVGWLLVDTWDKSAGSLLDIVPWPTLREWKAKADECTLQLALAGSLRVEHVSALAALHPAVIAVRTAACENGRQGVVSAAKVRDLAGRLRTPADCRLP